jgi:hypothetical protein
MDGRGTGGRGNQLVIVVMVVGGNYNIMITLDKYRWL